MLIFVFTGYVAAQNKVVRGVVTSKQTGESLPGVTVLLKGTQKGVASDMDGKYELKLTQNEFVNGSLLFSYIGYITQEVEIQGDPQATLKVIDMELATDIQMLNDVVVIGYGAQTKATVTGNISRVSAKDLQDVSVNSLEQAIQGKAAGVYIQANNGKLGQGILVRVRGSASLTASNQPLYIIDGIPVTTANLSRTAAATNPLADINPNDIESIEILKDAAAASIYGARGSNGVVLITTKTGNSGKTKFNFNYAISTSKPSGKMDWLNADEYLELFTESFYNSPYYDPETGLMFGEYTRDGLFDDYLPGWDAGNDTDWQELAFQDNTSQTFELTASGGNEKTTFFASGQIDDQQGYIIDNEFNRMSGRINVDHTASDKISLGMNLNLVRTENHRLSDDNQFSTPIQLVAQSPLQAAYNDDGTPTNNTLYDNGLLFRDGASFVTTVFRTIGRAYAAYKPLSDLVVRGEFGVDVLDQNEERYYGSSVSQFTGNLKGAADNRFVRVVNYTAQAYATYTKTFSGLHNVEGTVGLSSQVSETDVTSVSGIDFPNDLLHQVASTATINGGTASTDKYSFIGYFARANYNYDQKYLFSLSGRIDGSSRFGENERYGFFPAASAGWVLTKEPFLEGIDFLSLLKIRTSYGLTGNAEIDNFAPLGLYGARSYAGYSGLAPTQSPNPDLKWETTKQFNIGLDFGIFADRISGELDYYIKKTEDLLLNINVPATTGFSSQLQNVGKLENKGIELLLTTRNITGEFSWSTTFNIGKNKNEITNLNGQVIEDGFVSRAIEGEPIGVFFTREYAGVDPDNGDALYWINSPDGKKDHSLGTTNSFNAANRVVVGDPNPDFQGGISNALTYKGFDLNIFFQFVYGNKIYNGGGTFQSANAAYFDNQTKDQLNRWQNPGDITDVPQARLFDSNGDGESSRYVSDGSYLRLKTLTFGYSLPEKRLSKYGVNKIRFYFTGLNLLTFTEYEGWDPEVNTDFTASNITLGTDFYAAPQARTYTFGVNIGF